MLCVGCSPNCSRSASFSVATAHVNGKLLRQLLCMPATDRTGSAHLLGFASTGPCIRLRAHASPRGSAHVLAIRGSHVIGKTGDQFGVITSRNNASLPFRYQSSIALFGAGRYHWSYNSEPMIKAGASVLNGGRRSLPMATWSNWRCLPMALYFNGGHGYECCSRCGRTAFGGWLDRG
jgi:hypothetical protein